MLKCFGNLLFFLSSVGGDAGEHALGDCQGVPGAGAQTPPGHAPGRRGQGRGRDQVQDHRRRLRSAQG